MTAMTREQLLAALCPHGIKLRDCQELWCHSRVEDLESGAYGTSRPRSVADLWSTSAAERSTRHLPELPEAGD